MNKKPISYAFVLAFCLSLNTKAQVTISSKFNSQNYWMPAEGGYFGGDLESYWGDIVSSGVKSMRVGGIAYDAVNNSIGTTHKWTSSELASGTSSIIYELKNTYNLDPIIQVPIDITQSIATNVTNAQNLVYDINVTHGRNITYWEIGNEPNTSYGGTNNYHLDNNIQSYIQQVSTAMKGVAGQSGIKIIAPSFSFYNSTSYNNLLGGTNDITGSGANGYYIDYIDFHTYPFQNECFWNTGHQNCSTGYAAPTRADVINYIAGAYNFKANLQSIIDRIGTHTLRSGTLGLTVTEANISYNQDTDSRDVYGLGPGSFLGGQFWAEMMGAAMEKGVEFVSFWGVKEGSGPDYLTDLGYIGAETDRKRSTYWHYKMLATNFTGTFLPNVSSYTGNTNCKAFACTTGSEIRVLVMNQAEQSPRGSDNTVEQFKIKFDGTTPASGIMRFSFAAGSGTEYTCDIQKEASMFLAFNLSGGFLRSEVYTLQDALRGESDVGPNTWVGGTQTINSSALYVSSRSNNAKVYTTITIGGAAITPGTLGNNTYQFTSSGSINGSSGLFSSSAIGVTGNSLCITAADATCD